MIIYSILGQTFEVVYIHKKIKHTYMRMNRPHQITITTPLRLSKNDIITFLDKHEAWVKRQVAKMTNAPSKNVFLWFGTSYNQNDDFNNHPLSSPFTNKNQWIAKGYQIISNMFDIAAQTHYLFGKPKLVFKKMKSRWGVCHYHKKTIVLNTALIHIPKELINYVIYHELAHLVHPNHSEKFYHFLQLFVPNYKKYRKMLKSYAMLLYDT